MSNLLRQAFLSSSGGGNSLSGGGFSRAPSISSGERFVGHSPMPVHAPIPSQVPPISSFPIETTSLRVGDDYQGNGFVNRTETAERMADKFRQIPNITPEQAIALSKISTDLYLEELKKSRKNPNGFAFLDLPLPEGTEWENIKIQITGTGGNDAKNWTVDLYLHGKKIKSTNFHEMELDDTVRGGVSKSGRVLIFLALKGRFKWETKLTPGNLRKAKERLSDDLKKIFGISSDPVEKINNAYFPRLTIGMNHNLTEIIKRERLEEIFNF